MTCVRNRIGSAYTELYPWAIASGANRGHLSTAALRSPAAHGLAGVIAVEAGSLVLLDLEQLEQLHSVT